MTHGKNGNETFAGYLKRTAVKTRHTDWAIFARNVRKAFKHRSYKQMKLEDVSADMMEELEYAYADYSRAGKSAEVDPCKGWDDLGGDSGGRMAPTHLCGN